MNLRDDDQVSAVALVAESEAQTAAPVAEDGVAEPEENGAEPEEYSEENGGPEED